MVKYTVQWMTLLDRPRARPCEWCRCLLRPAYCREHGLFVRNGAHDVQAGQLCVYIKFSKTKLADTSSGVLGRTYAFFLGPSCRASTLSLLDMRLFTVEVSDNCEKVFKRPETSSQTSQYFYTFNPSSTKFHNRFIWISSEPNALNRPWNHAQLYTFVRLLSSRRGRSLLRSWRMHQCQ